MSKPKKKANQVSLMMSQIDSRYQIYSDAAYVVQNTHIFGEYMYLHTMGEL